MSIIEVESSWRETGIICPWCGNMTYSDGKHTPQCGNDQCLTVMPLEYIWECLITMPEFLDEVAAEWSRKPKP